MSSVKEKHLERLTQGKSSGAFLGSRAVAHRLRNDEKRIFTHSIQKRFLSLKPYHRINLENFWEQYCRIKNWPMIILRDHQDGTAEVTTDHHRLFIGTLKNAKKYAQTLSDKSFNHEKSNLVD